MSEVVTAEKKEIDQIKENLDTIEAFKADEANLLNAEMLAKQIQSFMGSGWFVLRKLKAKTGVSDTDLNQKIKILELFNLIVSKQIGPVTHYRIDLKQDQLRKLLKIEINALEEQKQRLIIKLNKLVAGKES